MNGINQIIKTLQNEIKKNEQNVVSLKISSRSVPPDNAIGRLSRMDAIGAQKISEANLSKAQIRLKLLEQALKRAIDGEYGICLICEEEISKSRLNSIPEATHCISCASKYRAPQ